MINKFFSFLDNSTQKKNFRVLRKYLGNKINIFIDVGAHLGETINDFNLNFRIERIFAFEPNPYIFKKIKPSKKNVKLFNLGISNTNKTIKFKIGNISSMSTLSKINENSFYTKFKKIIIFFLTGKIGIYNQEIYIKIIKLKDFIEKNNLKKIDMLKIDTEGHEYQVLKGLENKIKNIKIILFEHHFDKSIIKGYNFKKINNYLQKKNFKMLCKQKMLFRNSYELIYINNLLK